jgi:hypothetical protein
MIDEEWLRDLRFTTADGVRITGLVGLGSGNIVFEGTLPDGERVVLKLRRHHLGFHIRELPLFLTGTPAYDVDRLNRKLLRLVGNPLLDEMTRDYDRLYSSVIKVLHEHGTTGLIGSTLTPESTETIPFILQTPGMRRRLADIAALGGDVTDLREAIVNVNGENFRITGFRKQLVEWAERTLGEAERIWQPNADIHADRLPENPLYVWGAAVTDGFFTDAELPRAVDFITEQFGPLVKHPEMITFMEQASGLAHLLAQFLNESEVTRFVKLCAMAGFIFTVIDRSGAEIANGYQLLS